MIRRFYEQICILQIFSATISLLPLEILSKTVFLIRINIFLVIVFYEVFYRMWFEANSTSSYDFSFVSHLHRKSSLNCFKFNNLLAYIFQL